MSLLVLGICGGFGPEGTSCFGLFSSPPDKGEKIREQYGLGSHRPQAQGVLSVEASSFIFNVSFVLDQIASVTLIVLGVLGALSTLHFSRTATCALLGVGGGVFCIELPLLIKGLTKGFDKPKN
ncbi:MAG: hypothetical protein K940chlam9_00873 [Chlamydiae bacterium]|nr:hypothetical protein [Chlamydiota bacterium]